MTVQVGVRPSAALSAFERGAVSVSTGRLVAAAVLSAVMAAASSRPWGLGALALVAFIPAFSAIARAQTALAGAGLAAIASFGVASVAYEATVAIGVHIYVLALLLAPLPYAVAGAVAVRFGRAVQHFANRRQHGAGTRHGRWTGRIALVVALPVLWCAAEWLPAQPGLWGVYAMPLGAIGYSQADLPTLHLAGLSSVTAVSAVVLACNALLILTVWRMQLPVLRLVAVTALAGLALLVVVVWQRGSGPGGSDGALIQLVQPNLPDSSYLAA
ncbi:MAG TPA: hypothetical protein VKZ43_04750, partial [Trueperaceae bacterium]|nr:hypothetical protein [Trueperaceae bacterium]